jgi:hypothetical protein
MRRRAPLIAAATVAAMFAGTFAAHASDIHIHGLAEVTAAGHGEAYEYNFLMRGDSPFDPYSLRVFADAQPNPHLQIYSQLMLRDATGAYVDGAYLMYTPTFDRDFHVLAGKIPWAIGTYAPRTYSNRNPLISAPLMYQYHTTLLWYAVPQSADELLATAGEGEAGPSYSGYQMGRGMSVVDDSYWDAGVTLTGSERPLEYALSVTAGTPGWGNTARDENGGKSVMGRVGLAPLPNLRLGTSFAFGPYLDEALNPSLPVGRVADDYHQKLAMADLELLMGHVELRAEGARNAWEMPRLGNLRVSTGYLELKYALAFGGFVAGRYDVMRFSSVTDSTGAQHPWDSNVNRIEAGVGYRFTRDAQAKIVYQHTELVKPDENERLPMFAAQLSVAF